MEHNGERNICKLVLQSSAQNSVFSKVVFLWDANYLRIWPEFCCTQQVKNWNWNIYNKETPYLSALDFRILDFGVYFKLGKKSSSKPTWFFFEFELDFYCLCSLPKSISKSNWFFSFLNLIFWNWKKFEWHSISQKSSGDRQGECRIFIKILICKSEAICQSGARPSRDSPLFDGESSNVWCYCPSSTITLIWYFWKIKKVLQNLDFSHSLKHKKIISAWQVSGEKLSNGKRPSQ